MDIPQQPEQAPGGPAREFVAHSLRIRGAVGLVLFGGLLVLILISAVGGGLQSADYVALLLCGVMVAAHLAFLLNPPRVKVDARHFVTEGTLRLRTPVANVRAIGYDGTGLAVAFHDLDQVAISGQQMLQQMAKKAQAEGVHIHLPGFTLAQVEEIRQALGVPAPGPDEPAGRVEQFQHDLRTAGPRCFVTYALIAANVVVFVLMLLAGVHPSRPTAVDMVAWGSNFGPLTLNGQWWRLLTSMFLHFGVIHLFFNLWVLSDIGPLMERLVGNVAFLVLYVVAGLAGSVASVAWHPEVVSAGASGAIFGLFGGLLGFLVRSRKGVPPEVLGRLRSSGIAFFGYNLIFGAFVPSIDQAAHVGGAVGGFLGGLVLWRPLGAAGATGAAALGQLARAGALAGATAVAVVAALTWMPRPPADVGRFLLLRDELGRVEDRVLKTYKDAFRRLEAGQLSEEGFADVLERDVLPPWRDIRRRFLELGSIPPQYEKRWPLLREYLEAREEAWELQVKYVRQHDPAALEQAKQKAQRAAELAKQVSAAP